MKKPEVVEYFLDSSNFIIGWKLSRADKRPDLIGIPMPTAEMNNSLFDAYGKYKFKIVDNLIVEVTTSPTEKERAYSHLMKLSKDTIVKAIINGVETNGEGTGYNSLKDLIIASNGDLNDPV